MQLQILFILTFTDALFARGFPLPISNAIAKAAHISYIVEDAKLDVRSAEPMGSLKGSGLATIAGTAGENGYTEEDAEFYVR